jgi:ubiquinone biosynthesis protein UbiJ
LGCVRWRASARKRKAEVAVLRSQVAALTDRIAKLETAAAERSLLRAAG